MIIREKQSPGKGTLNNYGQIKNLAHRRHFIVFDGDPIFYFLWNPVFKIPRSG
jgi:hypothetical protein